MQFEKEFRFLFTFDCCKIKYVQNRSVLFLYIWHRLLANARRTILQNDFNFSSCQLTEPPRFIVIRVLDQSAKPRSRSRTIAYPSDSKVRSVYTGIWTSLMTVITARLDTSIARFVGFLRLGYFTIESNPPRWSGSRPSRRLRQIETANLVPLFPSFDPRVSFRVSPD